MNEHIIESESARARPCPSCQRESGGPTCDWCGVAQQAGEYTIDRVIAQTPHSRVYLAHRSGGAPVALKELQFATVPSTEALDSFERESKTLRELCHPGIPAFAAAFTVGEGVQTRFYLAEEFVAGESLATRLKRGALSEAQVKSLARQALEILVYLQGRNPIVIHRDVKPDNLMIRADGSLVLVDYGTVRRSEGHVTHRSTLVGTFGYMPPEQLGGTVGTTTDVYALAATLLEAIAGQPIERLVCPFEPIRWPADISPRLREWLSRALASMPADRWVDARAALFHLESASPLPARGSTMKVKWARKNGVIEFANSIGFMTAGTGVFGVLQPLSVMSLLFLFVGGMGAIEAIVFAMNRSRFCIGTEVLRVRHGPLPWRLNQTIARRSFVRADLEARQVRRKGEPSYTVFSISCALSDNQNIEVATALLDHREARRLVDFLNQQMPLEGVQR